MYERSSYAKAIDRLLKWYDVHCVTCTTLEWRLVQKDYVHAYEREYCTASGYPFEA
jgi:hypothetical protein